MAPGQGGQDGLLQPDLRISQIAIAVLVGSSSILSLRQPELWPAHVIIHAEAGLLAHTQKETTQHWTNAIDMTEDERLD